MSFRMLVGQFEIHGRGPNGERSVPQSEAAGFDVFARHRCHEQPMHGCTRFEDAFDFCIARVAMRKLNLRVVH